MQTILNFCDMGKEQEIKSATYKSYDLIQTYPVDDK